MEMKMFSVHDSKAEGFIQPFFAPNDAVASRMFERAANDPTTDISRFAEDYTLFEVGSFDQNTGKCTSLETPKSLGLALIFKASKEDRDVNKGIR